MVIVGKGLDQSMGSGQCVMSVSRLLIGENNLNLLARIETTQTYIIMKFTRKVWVLKLNNINQKNIIRFLRRLDFFSYVVDLLLDVCLAHNSV